MNANVNAGTSISTYFAERSVELNDVALLIAFDATDHQRAGDGHNTAVMIPLSVDDGHSGIDENGH